jgi:hypothetical protein
MAAYRLERKLKDLIAHNRLFFDKKLQINYCINFVY